MNAVASGRFGKHERATASLVPLPAPSANAVSLGVRESFDGTVATPQDLRHGHPHQNGTGANRILSPTLTVTSTIFACHSVQKRFPCLSTLYSMHSVRPGCVLV